MICSKDEANSALKLIQYTISRGSDYFVFNSEREDNQKTLIRLGITPKDAIEIMENLSVEDYSEGPEVNKSKTTNKEAKMWVFGKEVHGLETLEVYVKFSVFENKHGTSCTCVSFHEAVKKIDYPFK